MKKGISLDEGVENIWKKLDYKIHDNLRFLIDSAIVGTAYTVASKAIVDYGLDKINFDWINEKNLEILALSAVGALTGRYVGRAISSFYRKRKARLEEHRRGISKPAWITTGALAVASLLSCYVLKNSDILNNFNINNESISMAIDYIRNGIGIKTIAYSAIPLAAGGSIAATLKKLYQKRPSLKGWSRKKAIAYGTIASLLFLSFFDPFLNVAKPASNRIKIYSQEFVQRVYDRLKKGGEAIVGDRIEGYTLEQYVGAMVPFIQEKYKLKTRRDMPTRTAKVYAEADFKVVRIYNLPLYNFSALSYQESEYRNVKGDPKNVIIVNGKKILNPAKTRHQMLESTIQEAFARVKRDKTKLEELRKAGFYIPEKLPEDIEKYPKLTTVLAANQFSYLINWFNGDIKKAIGGWNGGPGRPNKEYGKKVEKKAKEIGDYLKKSFINKGN